MVSILEIAGIETKPPTHEGTFEPPVAKRDGKIVTALDAQELQGSPEDEA